MSTEAYESVVEHFDDVIDEGYETTPEGRLVKELHSAFREHSSWTDKQIFRFIHTLNYGNSTLEGILLAKDKGLFESFVRYIVSVVEFFEEEFDLSDPVDTYIEEKGTGTFHLDVETEE